MSGCVSWLIEMMKPGLCQGVGGVAMVCRKAEQRAGGLFSGRAVGGWLYGAGIITARRCTWCATKLAVPALALKSGRLG
jgi:hypothetical protein